jgi:hypothetical protein
VRRRVEKHRLYIKHKVLDVEERSTIPRNEQTIVAHGMIGCHAYDSLTYTYSDSNNCPNVLHFLLVCHVALH